MTWCFHRFTIQLFVGTLKWLKLKPFHLMGRRFWVQKVKIKQKDQTTMSRVEIGRLHIDKTAFPTNWSLGLILYQAKYLQYLNQWLFGGGWGQCWVRTTIPRVSVTSFSVGHCVKWRQRPNINQTTIQKLWTLDSTTLAHSSHVKWETGNLYQLIQPPYNVVKYLPAPKWFVKS